MKLLRWFNCWMFGHEPDDKQVEMEFFGEDLIIGICTCCGSTISYEHGVGWVKW